MSVYAINEGTGHLIAVTATSGNTALHASFATARQAKVTNVGASPVCIRMGPSSQTAVTTDFCLAAGESAVVGMSPTYTNIGAICTTGTSTLSVTPVSMIE